MNDIINKDIQVANIEAKMASTGNMKYILTDNQKNKYYFYQKNKGVDCDVYLSFTGMGLKIGDSCHIGFTEEPKSFTNPKGELINYTDRFILGLRESTGANPTPAPSQSQTPRGMANSAFQGESKDAFSRRLGIQGHINAMLSNPKVFAGTEESVDTSVIVRWAIEIEAEAEKQLNPSSFRQAVNKVAPQIAELPVIQQNEDIAPDIAEHAQQIRNEVNVDDIPY